MELNEMIQIKLCKDTNAKLKLLSKDHKKIYNSINWIKEDKDGYIYINKKHLAEKHKLDTKTVTAILNDFVSIGLLERKMVDGKKGYKYYLYKIVKDEPSETNLDGLF